MAVNDGMIELLKDPIKLDNDSEWKVVKSILQLLQRSRILSNGRPKLKAMPSQYSHATTAANGDISMTPLSTELLILQPTQIPPFLCLPLQ